MLSTLRNAGPAAIRQAARPMAGRAMASKASDMGAYKHNYDAIIEQRAVAAKQELATLAEAFMRYDGDGNGHLDRDELVAALADLELPAGEVDVANLLAALDSNADGVVQLTEWLDHLPKGTRLKIADKYGEPGGSPVDGHRNVRMSVPGGGAKIIYTHTDEAPMLATYSLLPIVRAFTQSSDIDVELKDISVAGRILANFPDYLEPSQRVDDALMELGELAKTPQANIIKLPNVSAALPQLLECIEELQSQGYAVPDYPVAPANDTEKGIAARYAKVIGSTVNPVLREGNSDRRVAGPVKEYAKANPVKLKAWDADSATHVAHMQDGDFFSSEQSTIMKEAATVRIEHVAAARHGGATTVLKAKTALQKGEVIDSGRMDVAALRAFFEEQIEATKALPEGTLLSLHLKATMMKVSDPIMFGHAVTVYYKDVFAKHGALFEELGVNPNNGVGDVYAKIEGHPMQAEVEADLMKVYETQPPLAMVDSRKGITNLHAPNDVIIDASVPPVIRDGGKMWNWGDELANTKMMIPDRSYATMYSAIVEDCKANGAMDASTMGNVSNVGLMAQKAEEYGSHDKTFEIATDGVVRVVDAATGSQIFEHEVSEGDIWRMCQTKDSPIQDWVKLAVSRARATGDPAVFWLNEERPHDATLIGRVNEYLQDHDLEGLTIEILPPKEAMDYTLARVRKGEDTISVTGNVLRDYLTDLFPILELGTSAKMLSIVPLLAGGGLFETGAGGSAPKHVEQLVKENHLRWDSLGEFLALGVSIEDLAAKTGTDKALVVAEALNTAVGRVLTEGKSPGRKVGLLDNRGSHFYLGLFWAEALAAEGGSFGDEFASLAADLRANEQTIVDELMAAAGTPADVGGYYQPDHAKAEKVMRPSATLNNIIDSHLEGAQQLVA
jgi:isocitrate dehydrogenase